MNTNIVSDIVTVVDNSQSPRESYLVEIKALVSGKVDYILAEIERSKIEAMIAGGLAKTPHEAVRELCQSFLDFTYPVAVSVGEVRRTK